MPTNILLSQYLSADHIWVPLHARSYVDAIAEMVASLVRLGEIRDVQALKQTFARTRDVVSLGNGVVLPHVRTDAVDRLIVSLGIANQPLDTRDSALDEEPRVIALVIAPPEAATLYLQTVGALARFLEGPHVVERLHAAKSSRDITQIPEFGALKIEPELTVRDLMMHDVTTVSPNTLAREAVALMVSRKQRALPVVDTNGEVLGIVTEWDVMRALVPHIPRVQDEEEADDLAVREVMTRSVLCVPQEMGLEEAVNLMVNKKAEQFPVVREGVFAGLLTRSDIVRKLFAR